MTIAEQVFQALKNPKWTFRTIRGLSLETGLDPEDVKIYLRILNERGLVQFVNTAKGPSWTANIAAAHEVTRKEATRFRERTRAYGDS